MEKNNCDCNPQNEFLVQQIQSNLPNHEETQLLSDFLKIMSDATRLKILMALQQSELCVSDLANIVNMSKSAVSHQLKTLRISKLVKSRRDGKIIIYSLDDQHIQDILAYAMIHIKEK